MYILMYNAKSVHTVRLDNYGTCSPLVCRLLPSPIHGRLSVNNRQSLPICPTSSLLFLFAHERPKPTFSARSTPSHCRLPPVFVSRLRLPQLQNVAAPLNDIKPDFASFQRPPSASASASCGTRFEVKITPKDKPNSSDPKRSKPSRHTRQTRLAKKSNKIIQHHELNPRN